eukprot:scaffold10518_cov43-Cyclotella_meneghiniana.AAC.2
MASVWLLAPPKDWNFNASDVMAQLLGRSIAEEPAFNWWVGWVLKKRDRIISLVKKRRTARYLKRDYKFGVEMQDLSQPHCGPGQGQRQ